MCIESKKGNVHVWEYLDEKKTEESIKNGGPVQGIGKGIVYSDKEFRRRFGGDPPILSDRPIVSIEEHHIKKKQKQEKQVAHKKIITDTEEKRKLQKCSEDRELVYTCEKCDRHFLRRSNLEIHMTKKT
mmetsp:Transcript_743/g.921  ORF Transcript_743/g.921 Transcript_743/m.921 type:complete len:129 (-) Transcript_743:346-732(-)